MVLPLEGVRVLDFCVVWAGPFATMLLGDLGAEVIKVEPPDGDPGRHIRPPDARTSVFFRNMGRGKKSVVLDLKSEQGRADLFRLACEADVIVESFRPGVAARFGIGYEAVKAANPGIVYCSISAFGQDGAYPGRAAHDLALEAMTGVLSLTLGDDGRPAIPGIPVADLVSGVSFHAGEVRRNPFHLLLPAWMQDNVRRGSELVGGQGEAAPDFGFATLYRLRWWRGGSLGDVLGRGRHVGCGEHPGPMLDALASGSGQPAR